MHRRKVLLAALFTLVVAALIAAPMASAASPHFKKGGTPSCTFSAVGTATDTVTCSGGTLAGLGSGDVTFALSGGGFATFTCENKGGNEAAGQNKVPVSVTPESETVSGGDIKNGNLTGPTLTTAVPTPTATGEEAGCPNPNWTANVAAINITSVQLLISQGGKTIFTCTASNPSGFQEGASVTLSCAK
jgi:hypothetical protein